MSRPKKKVRQYSERFLEFGFIEAPQDKRLAYCLLCHQSLSNESMRLERLQGHLTQRHPENAMRDRRYFQNLKGDFEKRRTVPTLFDKQTEKLNRTLEASHEISLLIARAGKPHSIGETLIKPAISSFLKTVMRVSDDDVKSMPLSNDTVRRRIDEMAEDVEIQVVEKLRSRDFSLQLDESTVRDGEALLLAFVRYIDNGEFQEEMVFCESLVGSTRASDIYHIVKKFFTDRSIPMKNMISCAADGAPAMMGRRTGCLQLLKADSPDLLTVHCVIHRENLVAKNLSPILHEALHTVIRCINKIKANAKFERLFKLFCVDRDEKYVRLLLHTEIRWLSKGNCLRRFMELIDSVMEFLGDTEDIKYLRSKSGRAYISYLTDIFGKLNVLNKELQGRNTTLLDSKQKIAAFSSMLEIYRPDISNRRFGHFPWLGKCEVDRIILKNIDDHLVQVRADFAERFADIECMVFHSWLSQPFLTSLCDVKVNYQEEIAQLQHCEIMKPIFRERGCLMWLDVEAEKRFPISTAHARRQLTHFASTYLVECGFSAVTELLVKKRSRLDITKRGDLRLMLTQLEPRIRDICKREKAQPSH